MPTADNYYKTQNFNVLCYHDKRFIILRHDDVISIDYQIGSA